MGAMKYSPKYRNIFEKKEKIIMESATAYKRCYLSMSINNIPHVVIKQIGNRFDERENSG
jgi:hypothetical protein